MSSSLNAAIVGAGIAGLAAGIALKRASPSHSVTIYEKSSFKNEIGAAITLTPNANLIMDHWGFDAVAAGETDKRQVRLLDAQTLEVLYQLGFDGVREKYGHAFNAFHRVDLHRAIRKMAEDLGVKIELAKEVVGVVGEEGRVIFKNGKEICADLVVVADGLKVSLIMPDYGDFQLTRRAEQFH